MGDLIRDALDDLDEALIAEFPRLRRYDRQSWELTGANLIEKAAAALAHPAVITIRAHFRLRQAAVDVAIQEGRYHERDGTVSKVLAVIPKAALDDLRDALGDLGPEEPGT